MRWVKRSAPATYLPPNRLRSEIEQILRGEVEHRYRLISDALAICRRFPASVAAEHIGQQDRGRHDRNHVYVADPQNQLAARLSGDAATAEFLSRELNAEHLEGLKVRSVSGARGAARLSGDILIGDVVDRWIQKVPYKTLVHYRVRTGQDRISIRRGDKLTLIDDDTFTFVVSDLELGVSGETLATLDLTAGKRKPGQPVVGDHVELTEPLGSIESISRTMGLAHDRLRTKPQPGPIGGQLAVRRDYLSGIKALRRDV